MSIVKMSVCKISVCVVFECENSAYRKYVQQVGVQDARPRNVWFSNCKISGCVMLVFGI